MKNTHKKVNFVGYLQGTKRNPSFDISLEQTSKYYELVVQMRTDVMTNEAKEVTIVTS